MSSAMVEAEEELWLEATEILTRGVAREAGPGSSTGARASRDPPTGPSELLREGEGDLRRGLAIAVVGEGEGRDSSRRWSQSISWPSQSG